MRDVVVTGVGAVTPLGAGARTLHERWAAGVCAVDGGEAPCADFDPLSTLSRKEARRADRFTQLALAAADEAMSDAGLADSGAVPPERIGSIVGTGIGGLATLESNQEQLLDRGASAVSPLAVPLMMGNAGAAAIALRYGLLGPCFGVVSACAAGANAIGSALRAIQSGEADVIIAGGAEAALTPLSRASFAALDATSHAGISRPFDVRRDGFVMGEGAGMLVLESAESARARGARPLGRLAGYGTTCDAHHLTAPDPAGAGAARAISAALRDAGIGPDGIDYVNAHGTSTPLNDRAETVALKTSLGERAGRDPRVLAEVVDRPPARRRRSGRGGGDDPRAARPDRAADARPRGAGPRARSRLRPRRRTAVRRPRRATRARHLELVRVRRPQRRARPGGRMRRAR